MLYLLFFSFFYFVELQCWRVCVCVSISPTDILHFSRVLYLKLFHMLQQHCTGNWVNNMIKHNALIPINIITCSCSLELFKIVTLCGFLCLFFVVSDMPGSPHNQFTFRPLPPPPPPPHACTCARKPPPTADSLQRRSMTTRSQPSPAAPTPPTSTQDSVHLHNSWVLNSNIPLETRYRPTCCTQHISNG